MAMITSGLMCSHHIEELKRDEEVETSEKACSQHTCHGSPTFSIALSGEGWQVDQVEL